MPRPRDITTTATSLVPSDVLIADPASGSLGKITASNARKFFGPFAVPEDFGAVGDGTTNDNAAILAACDAAGSGVVWLTPGKRYNVGTTLSLSGKRCVFRSSGGGVNTSSAILGAEIYAATQSGPVLNMTGYAGLPNNQIGQRAFEGFTIRGSNSADATKANVG